jgi:endoglucanase
MSIPASRTAVIAALTLALSALFAPALTAQTPADPRGVDPAQPNPLEGERFFVDHQAWAWRQYRWYLRQHRGGAAAQMLKLASRPQFRWFGRWDRPLGPRLRDYIARARSQGSVPQILVLRHQKRGCGNYDAGGSAEDARTRRWYRTFARAVGSSRVVIAFEPDSLGTIDCLSPSRRGAMLDLLRYGVDTMSALPNATVYLEAGASDWEPAERTAKQLRYIGIAKVRGFMLNVTHMDWTGNNVLHGLKISRLTGGKHFIVNTSSNGRGPVHQWRVVSGHRRRINVWCNPSGRGLGPAPTTHTARPEKVDAYMWIGRPGYSAGACNGGPMPVGKWWPTHALMYARNSTNWVFPP